METIEAAVFEFWVWQYKNTGSFFSQLISLFQKADMQNKSKLASIWPNLGIVWAMWNAAGNNGDDLFKQWNLPLSGEAE